MRILLINNVYSKGSTGKIVENLYNSISKKNDTYVIYGRGNVATNDYHIQKVTNEIESKIHHFISLFTGNMYGGMFFSTYKIIGRIKEINPDIVNLHCINGYFVNIYLLLRYLAKMKYKTVLTMHADFMMTGGCGYSVDCTNYLTCKCKHCRKFKTFNSKFSINSFHNNYKKIEKTICSFDSSKLKISCVSPWLTRRYEESEIYEKLSVSTILNPINSIFFETANENPYNKPLNVLYITPDIYDKEKCGYLIEDVAELLPQYLFTIICAKNVEYTPKHLNINYIKGGMEHNLLKNYYYFANVTLILSKRETFSMIVAESLASGTPVAGFKCGGPETIGIPRYCSFVDYGDFKSLANSIHNFISNTNKEEIRKTSKIKYNEKDISNSYLSLYKN